MMEYLSGLNEPQKEAVLHKDGPVMIVAGAGSGKTKVLTTRITHILSSGVSAFNILALTFTNKAAREMKERIEKQLGNSDAKNLYLGTFHSVFARVLRRDAPLLGYPNNFTIYDAEDAKSVVKTVVNELNLDDKHYKPSTVYNRISAAKNALITPVEYLQDYHIQQEDITSNRPQMGKVFKAYCEKCFKNGAMDFDDLLLKFYELIKNIPERLSYYQHKFKYILIDEYQDTNPAQYEIIKLLGAMHENVCVVGDDAQSIYSFRGATIQNILQFKKDYNDVKLIKLEQNYRSTKTIINIANSIIANNIGQIEKNLFTENQTGEKIQLVRTASDNDEGKYIADSIMEQKLRNHYNNNDFAILYRTNAQSRSFEESLRRLGISYIIYGGISFYQRKEIKDIIGYLRLLVNNKDEEALKRIINYPARGIGKTTIDRAILAANENNITMWEVIENAAKYGFRASTAELLNEFVIMIKSFTSMLANKNAYEVAFHVGKHTQIVQELFNEKSTEGVQRYENIQELLNSIKEWTESPENDDGEVIDKGLGAYLQQITLLTDADEKKDGETVDAVKLMTIHAAKGLEFECVFAAGLEENLFPNLLSVNSREDLEEERRLFYVVITRAKSKLWITFANNRYKFGQLVQNPPSRFLKEIPTEFVSKNYSGEMASDRGHNNSAFDRLQGWRNGNTERKTTANPTPQYLPPKTNYSNPTEHTPTQGFIPNKTEDIKSGQKIEHQKFGFGTISKIDGAQHNPIATINFEINGERKIMLNYAKLRIVE